jgi:hypothetical protein
MTTHQVAIHNARVRAESERSEPPQPASTIVATAPNAMNRLAEQCRVGGNLALHKQGLPCSIVGSRDLK